jgi:hypothetical protein
MHEGNLLQGNNTNEHEVQDLNVDMSSPFEAAYISDLARRASEVW